MVVHILRQCNRARFYQLVWLGVLRTLCWWQAWHHMVLRLSISAHDVPYLDIFLTVLIRIHHLWLYFVLTFVSKFFKFHVFRADNSGLQMQTYLHHVVAITGAIGGAVINGVFGSLSQLTWFTEGSTFFVNMRWLMATHKVTDSPLYVLNGLMMAVSFFCFRIVLYTYMIFWVIYPFVMDKSGAL